MNVSPELNQSINNIMDTFSGGDNGKFWNFKVGIEELYELSQNGDEAANQILDKIRQFSRLIDSIDRQMEVIQKRSSK